MRDADDRSWVYKPIAHERRLHDFPAGTLARREVASYLLSYVMGIALVPVTVFVEDGPRGAGSMQRWIDDDAENPLVVADVTEGLPPHWHGFLLGIDEDDREIGLAHSPHPALRALALFDAVANNADRKGGHVLVGPDPDLGGIPHVWAVDNGLAFHTAPKLRTVLWGWAGQSLEPVEEMMLDQVATVPDGVFDGLITVGEIEALRQRAADLLAFGAFPGPSGLRPSLPWPPV
ncbi:SCO1664 family protein [Cutibacterium equinum]|uniref:SCO1664 family protein n=1 Tax=Cutibacterium equinum TaxID=3016342 RepID=A0ABY7R1F6_9ACTN|nr:SCO1664 family protein [Cutibacterium equinum]WCC81114.1 SCO1664 family protein [Cutibacterium equinum]